MYKDNLDKYWDSVTSGMGANPQREFDKRRKLTLKKKLNNAIGFLMVVYLLLGSIMAAAIIALIARRM